MDLSVLRTQTQFLNIAGGLWVLAFLCALMPFEAYENESFMLAVLFLAGAVLFTIPVARLPEKRSFFKSPIVFLFFAFWALVLLSAVLSEARYVSLIYFGFFSVLPLGFLLMVFAGGNARFLRMLGMSGAVVFAALGVSCVVQYFFMPEMLFYNSVRWPLSNPNSLAGVLSLGFFASVGWMFVAPSKLQSNVALVLAGLLFWAILTTASRGALVAISPAMILAAVLAPSFFKAHWRCLSALLVVMVVAAVLTTIFAPSPKETPLAMMTRTVDGSLPILWTRPAMWASTWQIIQNHFWSGTGIGTFFLYYPEFRSGGDVQSSGMMVHSDPIQFFAEMGVFAPVLFYLLCGAILVRSFTALRGMAGDDMRRVYVGLSCAALSAMVLHTHISFHFHVLSILTVAGIVSGFWFNHAVPVDREEGGALYSHPVQRGLIVLPILAGLAVFCVLQGSQLLATRGGLAMVHGKTEHMASYINRAGKVSYNTVARANVMAAGLPLGVLQLNAPLMDKANLKAEFENTWRLLERAEALNPRLAPIYQYKGELIAYTQPFLKGVMPEIVDEDARAYFRKALQIDALYYPARMKLADYYLREKKPEAALDVLQPGLKWRYRNQNPRLYLEKTYALAKSLGYQNVQDEAQSSFSWYFPGQKLQ